MAINKKETRSQKMESSKKRRSTSEVIALQKRILEAKEKLPPGAIPMFIEENPSFNQYKKISRVRNVYSLMIVDEEITEKFELLAIKYEESIKK